jgi:hypothetical protein
MISAVLHPEVKIPGTPRAIQLMGKKTTTSTKAAAPEKRAAKPATKSKRTAEPAVITPPAKPATPRKTTLAVPKSASPKRTVKPAAKPAPAYTQADISLRAYFIAEKRIAVGLPGDPHQDWLEAERQLKAEAASPKKAGAKRKKA